MVNQTIFELIEKKSIERPEAAALKSLGRPSLSYSNLTMHIRDVVRQLNGFGIGRRDRIAIVLPNGPEMATACLAVTATAICAPLNPEYKQDEFEFYLGDLDARALIVQAGMNSPAVNAAGKTGIPVIELFHLPDADTGLFELAQMDLGLGKSSRPGLSQLDDTAMIMHTSGSTSRPKIVPLTQRNITASVLNVSQSLSLTADDSCLNVMPLFHIGGLVDVLFTPLAVGGEVICTSNFSIVNYEKCLEQFSPSWCQVPPAMLKQIVERATSDPALIEKSSIKFMRSVSAPLPEQLLREFEKLFDIPIIEIYGMTESSGLITSNPMPPGKRKVGSVGICSGPEVRIVDDTGTFLPKEKLGEIVIRGENIICGYENGEEINEDLFIDSWLRTGDQGYLDKDNYLFLTGRIKEIINRGGEKISPKEVDECLLSHAAIADAATFAVLHSSLGEDVEAAVVLKEGCTLQQSEIISFLEKKLAYFKVPRKVIFVSRIPRNANGKLQRHILAEELSSTEMQVCKYVQSVIPPETPLAIMLADMWGEALNCTGIGVHDNFFDLGGDSLVAAVFINKIQEKWGDIIYVSAIFEAPTIAEFETYLRKHYPQMVFRMLGHHVVQQKSKDYSMIDSEKIAHFQSSILQTTRPVKNLVRKNKSAIFILSTPRSGSTLLRAILGGNPVLFAPPELYLLSFDNLMDRKQSFVDSQRYRHEGNTRCLMEIKKQNFEQIELLMNQLEEFRTPIPKYYEMLQGWIGDQILVDKTPSYGLHLDTLKNAESIFNEPHYIYLQRHPYGMIRSFEESHLDQLWYPHLVGTEQAKKYPCPYTNLEMAEMIWLTINQNILEFLKNVPAQRHSSLQFEDLVTRPENTLTRLCDFLQIEFHPDMLKPQANKQGRMTDGIHPESRMIGDMKFHQHSGISAEAADLWKDHYSSDFLCDNTWEVAKSIGYGQSIADINDRMEFEI